MSTLRTDTLQTTDSSFTIQVDQIGKASDLSNSSDPTKGAALVGYKGRTVADKLNDRVSIKDFGAVCDGVTNDTVAFQAAVNACLATNPPSILEITGTVKINSSVNIDRLVDGATSQNPFRIRSTGRSGSIYVNGAITMFTSTLTSPTDPQSQMVWFEGVNFISESAADAAYVVDGVKFLRINFVNCGFQKIKMLTSTKYVQSVHVTNCDMRLWSGIFFNSTGGTFDIKFLGNTAEHGGPFFNSTDATGAHATSGATIANNLIEGTTGGDTITFDGGRGVTITGNYFEGNSGVEVKMDTAANIAGTSPNFGVDISGNFIAQTAGHISDVNYFAYRWGNCAGSHSSANWTNGRLHNTITASRLLVANDYQEVGALWTGSFLLGGTFAQADHFRVAASNASIELPPLGSGNLGTTNVDGLLIAGNGSTNDLTLYNKAGAPVLKVPTGTTGVVITNSITTGDTALHRTSASLTNGAGAGAGTLTNAPVAGNPTKWVPIVDNGVTRYIPTW